jgi:hypothetical protein
VSNGRSPIIWNNVSEAECFTGGHQLCGMVCGIHQLHGACFDGGPPIHEVFCVGITNYMKRASSGVTRYIGQCIRSCVLHRESPIIRSAVIMDEASRAAQRGVCQ